MVLLTGNYRLQNLRYLDEISRVHEDSCSTRWLQAAPDGVPGLQGSGTTVGGFCRGITQLSDATEIAGNGLRVSTLQYRDKKNHVQIDIFGAISRVWSTRLECARWIAHAAKWYESRAVVLKRQILKSSHCVRVRTTQTECEAQIG